MFRFGILIYRRRTVGPVFTATTRSDKLMYAVLALVIVLGPAATVAANVFGGGYDYRVTVSPWFRSVFAFQPRAELMAGAPLLFQAHAFSALALFSIWPFARPRAGEFGTGTIRDQKTIRILTSSPGGLAFRSQDWR